MDGAGGAGARAMQHISSALNLCTVPPEGTHWLSDLCPLLSKSDDNDDDDDGADDEIKERGNGPADRHSDNQTSVIWSRSKVTR